MNNLTYKVTHRYVYFINYEISNYYIIFVLPYMKSLIITSYLFDHLFFSILRFSQLLNHAVHNHFEIHENSLIHSKNSNDLNFLSTYSLIYALQMPSNSFCTSFVTRNEYSFSILLLTIYCNV